MHARLLTFLFVAAVLVAGDEDRKCTRTGIQCKDCSTLSICEEDDDGKGFHYKPYMTCPHYAMCDEKELYCVTEGYCRYKKFECPRKDFPDEVVFPDPYSCVQYHGCQLNDKFDYECDPGTAFNPAKKDCSLKISDPTCTNFPVPLCETEGQTGAVDGTEYSYTCVKEAGPPPILYPVLSVGGGVGTVLSFLYRFAGRN